MREQLTIVTAFFDIGRADWEKGFSRSAQQYIEYFQFWARIKNPLVVYTSRKFYKAIVDIRKTYGCSQYTKVIIIDSIFDFEKEMYDGIFKAASDPLFVRFHTLQENPETYNPYYDYVTCLKPIFVEHAVKSGFATGMIAWLDFGYNHGGEYFKNSLDFNFKWTVDLPYKINIFVFEDNLNALPIFEIVRTVQAYIAGGLVIAPDELWPVLANLYRQAVKSLSDCGFADDDQTALLMSYRSNPKYFNCVSIHSWMEPLQLTTQQCFEVVPQKRKKNMPHKRQKNIAKKEWIACNYGEAIKSYIKYILLKIQGE